MSKGRAMNEFSLHILELCKVRRTLAQLDAIVDADPRHTRKTIQNLQASGKLRNVAPPRPNGKRAREAVYLHSDVADAEDLKRTAPKPIKSGTGKPRGDALGWHIGADLANAWGIGRPAP